MSGDALDDDALDDDALARRFGHRVRAIRTERRLSQYDMAYSHGFSLSHYSRIERGRVEVRLPTMRKLAKSFGIELSELLEGV